MLLPLVQLCLTFQDIIDITNGDCRKWYLKNGCIRFLERNNDRTTVELLPDAIDEVTGHYYTRYKCHKPEYPGRTK